MKLINAFVISSLLSLVMVGCGNPHLIESDGVPDIKERSVEPFTDHGDGPLNIGLLISDARVLDFGNHTPATIHRLQGFCNSQIPQKLKLATHIDSKKALIFLLQVERFQV